MIQYIRSFCAELQRLGFFDLEYSGKSRINRPEARTEHGTGAQIPEITRRRLAERDGIEPKATESSRAGKVVRALISVGG